MTSELKLASVLRILTQLKLLLLKRFYQRNMGNAVSLIVLGLILLGLAAGGGGSLVAFTHAGGAVARDKAFTWGAWILSVLWLLSPLGQMDVQRNLDLSALRIYPLSLRSYSAAALLDALISPLAIFSIPLLLAGLAAFSLRWADVPVALLCLLTLFITLLGLGQALFLSVARLLSSRRFTDLSIVIGLVVFFSFQFFNLLWHAPQLLHLPPWLLNAAHLIRDGAQPVLQWAFPGLAARTLAAASSGNYAIAGGLYVLLLAQCGYCLWLAGLAAQRYYDGEVESGGPAQKDSVRLRSRPVRQGILPPLIGALFHRERIYLSREPLVKILYLQTVMGSLGGVMAIAIIAFNPEIAAEMDRSFGGAMWRSIGLFMLASLLSYADSAVLLNKLGSEGPLFVQLLLSPVRRREILIAKSLFFLSHFAALNVPLVLSMGLILHVPGPQLVAAVLLVTINTITVDSIGSLVSVYFPFTYRRVGRRVRPVPAQPGCGYLFLYGLAMQATNLAALPGGLALVLGSIYLGWAGAALGTLVAAAVCAGVWLFATPLGERALIQREPELVDTLSRSAD